MIKKTIGGERLGSGNRMKAEMHNYERSTHDLGNTWKSTMAPGVLVPFYKKICTNGDTWSINLQTLVKTVPAIGPMFGTYKLQLDVFEVPIRLYNGILHNNMVKIGMDMNKVKLPKMLMQTSVRNPLIFEESESEKRQISASSLWHYLGLKGIGDVTTTNNKLNGFNIQRNVNAVPVLAYYDIWKNYYSNKQEENGYVIDNDITIEQNKIQPLELGGEYTQIGGWGRDRITYTFNTDYETITSGGNSHDVCLAAINGFLHKPENLNIGTTANESLKLENGLQIDFTFKGVIEKQNVFIYLANKSVTPTEEYYYNVYNTIAADVNINGNTLYITIKDKNAIHDSYDWQYTDNVIIKAIAVVPTKVTTSQIKLQKFKLENIDRMRVAILSNTALNENFQVDEQEYYPYMALSRMMDDDCCAAKYPMSGLVLKTYQSDIFNNWLSQDWIQGINGINAISAVAIEDGKFTMDALNLAQKIYNMLNRIAVSGGTYEDWQEAVYGEDAIRHVESPIYCGGMSGIIAFEEVVSTSDTNTTMAGDQPLGTLAGKGTIVDLNGGNLDIHIKEPSYIIGIASITPYLDYCQGNDFDITELDSINDLHKPELDEIGFQDLMLERAAWWGTVWDNDNEQWIKHAGGKLPAWIEYMTSVNEVHGDFAEKEKLGFMVLTRDYEIGNASYNGSLLNPDAPLKTIPVKDWTTYINPTKYNYQFADTTLEAQNFWVQVKINAECRRKISAKLIPNL